MSATVIAAVAGVAIGSVVAFFVGYALGYGARIREEQAASRDERIRSALRHWHGCTTHRGHTIVSPDMPETGGGAE
jgi:hypothetical protein